MIASFYFQNYDFEQIWVNFIMSCSISQVDLFPSGHLNCVFHCHSTQMMVVFVVYIFLTSIHQHIIGSVCLIEISLENTQDLQVGNWLNFEQVPPF